MPMLLHLLHKNAVCLLQSGKEHHLIVPSFWCAGRHQCLTNSDRQKPLHVSRDTCQIPGVHSVRSSKSFLLQLRAYNYFHTMVIMYCYIYMITRLNYSYHCHMMKKHCRMMWLFYCTDWYRPSFLCWMPRARPTVRWYRWAKQFISVIRITRISSLNRFVQKICSPNRSVGGAPTAYCVVRLTHCRHTMLRCYKNTSINVKT